MDAARAVGWYQRNRARTRAVFDLIGADVYHSRPAGLRQPIGCLEGALVSFIEKRFLIGALGRPPIDERLASSFAQAGAEHVPSRNAVLEYAGQVDAAVVDALQDASLARDDSTSSGQALHAVLEYEAIQHERLLRLWHQLPHAVKRRPSDYQARRGGAPPPSFAVDIEAGPARLGADRQEIPFGWDHEFPATAIEVPRFSVDAYNVTNAQYLAFVDAGGEASPFWVMKNGEWHWRATFEDLPLPPAWPVYVTKEQAGAYARWRAARLMSEPEYHRAAYGEPGGGAPRLQPWGNLPADGTRGNFDFLSYEPVPVGSYPQGVSAFGVHDLVGNGWEWTATPLAPSPGFETVTARPEDSAGLTGPSDGEHFVAKGASPVTARELVRRSFRSPFLPNDPTVYATFRCAYDR